MTGSVRRPERIQIISESDPRGAFAAVPAGRLLCRGAWEEEEVIAEALARGEVNGDVRAFGFAAASHAAKKSRTRMGPYQRTQEQPALGSDRRQPCHRKAVKMPVNT